MSQNDPGPVTPTRKHLRDARRQAHEAQTQAGNGDDRKGRKGKGDRS